MWLNEATVCLCGWSDAFCVSMCGVSWHIAISVLFPLILLCMAYAGTHARMHPHTCVHMHAQARIYTHTHTHTYRLYNINFPCYYSLLCVLLWKLCIIRKNLNIKKGNSVPLQAWSGPEGSRKLRFPDFITMAKGGGKFVSLMHRPHLPPRNFTGTHFC
jgi:hypothetical protein